MMIVFLTISFFSTQRTFTLSDYVPIALENLLSQFLGK